MSDERRPLYGLFFGEVTRRDDPDNMGRVRFRIPGLIEDESSDWARQIGVSGSGHAQSGGPFEPPWVGANVAIFFEQGEIDKPVYLAGPWGAPGGTSDVPTGSAVEGDNRQNAVIEDQEWLIERDSQSAAQTYRIKHKDSGCEIVVHGTDRIDVVRDGATEAFMLGTSYRGHEVTAMGQLVTLFNGFALALNGVGADPAFAAAFPAAALILTTFASTTYPPLRDAFSTGDFASDPAADLSTKAWCE